jgi:hypothetical protein
MPLPLCSVNDCVDSYGARIRKWRFKVAFTNGNRDLNLALVSELDVGMAPSRI